MNIRFELGSKRDAFAVRTAVFINEQGFENEFDAIDEASSTIHITLYADNALAGCARVFPFDGEQDRFVFGRLAVLPEYRKNGCGRLLLERAEACARDAGARELHLHAQCSVTPFYEKHSYKSYGEIELDEHVEHIWMRKAL